jgi:hypothetical protein
MFVLFAFPSLHYAHGTHPFGIKQIYFPLRSTPPKMADTAPAPTAVGAAAPVVAGAGVGAGAVSAIFGGVERNGKYICLTKRGECKQDKH